MRIKLDWLSWSLPFPDCALFDDEQASIVAADHLDYFIGGELPLLVGEGGMERGNGRRPFSASWRNKDGSFAVYLNYKLSHFLIELSGKGCERVLGNEQGQRILNAIRERVTRVDIACDILCETNPLDFADTRGEARFKSHSEIVSETGVTYYVGSKKSDRYARVYRYAMPHPRSALLRVEHVFRDENAKSTLAYYLENGEEKTAAQCQMMYKWQHPSWDISPASEKELTAYRPDRENANTVFWAYDTIAPMLARLIREESIDISDYFQRVWRLSAGLSQSDAVDTESGEML